MFSELQFELIGRITIAFNEIEAIMDFYGPTFVCGPMFEAQSLAIAARRNLDEGHSFSKKIKVLDSLIRSLPKDSAESTLIGRGLALIEMAKELSRRRNRVVHGDVVLQEGKLVLRHKTTIIDSEVQMLESLLDEIADFVNVFNLACHELYTALSLYRDYSFSPLPGLTAES